MIAFLIEKRFGAYSKYTEYGLLYPMISTNTKQLNFAAIYFNPTQNDTNLEFDPNQNLAPFSNFEEEQHNCCIFYIREKLLQNQ